MKGGLNQMNNNFIEWENNLKICLNKKYGFDGGLFVQILKEMPFKDISTKYLKTLMPDGKTSTQKYNRIYAILKKCGLTTQRHLRFYTKPIFNHYKTDVIEYAISKDGGVYIKDCHTQKVGNFAQVDKNTQEVLYNIVL